MPALWRQRCPGPRAILTAGSWMWGSILPWVLECEEEQGPVCALQELRSRWVAVICEDVE